jgi:hypothetical protein
MTFCGHLFLAPGQQGDDPGEFGPEEVASAEALAVARSWARLTKCAISWSS